MISMKDCFDEALLNGECCSQIITRVALEMCGKRIEEMVKAMFGMCEGTRYGGTCGLVTAAACVLAMEKSREDAIALTEEFTDWFTELFGSMECNDLTEGSPATHLSFCRDLSFSCLEELAILMGWETGE